MNTAWNHNSTFFCKNVRLCTHTLSSSFTFTTRINNSSILNSGFPERFSEIWGLKFFGKGSENKK